MAPSVDEIQRKIAQLDKAVSSDSSGASALLIDIKIALTTLPALQPGVIITEAHLPEIALARDAYELGALLSVRQADEASFERHVAQAKTYYVDYASVLQPSPRQNLILGLNLVRLMGQNRIAEFHTELELVPAAARSDKMIDYALRLEHHLMEGSYSKMRDEQAHMPHELFSLFIGRLAETVRDEIAACCDRAYERLDIKVAMNMLSLQSEQELLDFSEQRAWTVNKEKNVIEFAAKEEKANHMDQVPSQLLIKRSLEYARELEQII